MERVRQVICGILLACLIPLMGAKQWEVGSRSFHVASGGGVTILPVGTPACNQLAGSSTLGVIYTPHASGDTLIVTTTNYAASTVTTSVSDGHNTYTSLASSNLGYPNATVWGVLSNTTMTALTIDTTFSAAVQGSMCVQEYSGPVAFGHTTTSTSTSSPYTASLTTQDPNNYVVCGEGNYGFISTATAGTIRIQTYGSQGNVLQDNTAATAGSVTISGTNATSNQAMGCVELRTL